MLCTCPFGHEVRTRAVGIRPRRARVAVTAATRARQSKAGHPRYHARPMAVSPSDLEPVLDELKDTSRLGQRGEWLCVPPRSPQRVCASLLPSGTTERVLHFPRFAAQALLLVGIVAPPDALNSIGSVAGVASLLGGLAFVTAGGLTLGSSLSPFPAPSKSNALVTTGPYAAVRHPMYTGLLLSSFGLSIVTASAARLALTAALFALLQIKMDAEEKALAERYGQTWETYAANTPRVVPSAASVQELIKTMTSK
jgi:protein-S-isoprenylcysteine O-methyltransferase Ste14